MDDYYATLLNSESTSTTDPSQSRIVTILVSRKSDLPDDHSSKLSSASNSSICRISAAVRKPRARNDQTDSIKFTIEYFTFLDDRRMFTNLDALLTRLAPVASIHLGCTESIESQTSSSKGKDKRFKEVSELLEKLSEVINSRTDIFQNERESTNIVETLPKHLSTATNLQSIDYSLAPLLGGDGDERYTAYKGDRTLANDPLTKRAIGLLLHVYNLEAERGSSGSYELSAGHLTSHLFLDRTASEAINLLPPPKHSGISTIEVGGADSNNSIFGILNRCKTKMGARMLELWLRQPLIDLNHIMYRQNAVHHMVEVNSLGRDKLRNEGLANLAGLDMDGFVSKLAGTVDLDGNLVGGSSRVLEYLYRLHLFADKQLPALIQALSCLVNPSENSVDNEDLSMTDALKNSWVGLNSAWRVLSRSIQLVEAILDFDLAPRAFLVKTSFNMELSEIRQDLDTVDEELEQIHAEMDEMWSHVSGDAAGQVRLEATDSNTNTGSCSWQFRLPDTNAAKVLQDGELSDKVTVHRVLKNGVYFSTKALRQLGVRKQDLLSEYDKHQRTIVQNAAVVAVTYVPILEKVSTIIAELDVLSGLAHAAAFSTNTYCCPELSDDVQDGCGIELIEARHPCVEAQDNVSFIPNDFRLIYGSSNFLIVTGPNCGGKSTYIRSLGAIVTMAQIGSYVPCSRAKINIVHHILARVGAGDLQDRGISTFMAEMLEASSILRIATKRSLIIIDELGRGTSTFDGYGLAAAISEYIIQKIGCFTVFATHFHELTELEDREPAVKNYHVTAQRATDGSRGLTFLYEVRPGPCLQSFGIQVAEMAHFPTQVVEDAKRKARLLENFDYRKKIKASEEEEKSNDHSDGISSALSALNEFKKLSVPSLTLPQMRDTLGQLFGLDAK